MRIILYTGKGGVGKTSIAAATALRSADLGQRTVIMSTDIAHSLSDSFDMPVGGAPTPVCLNLDAQEIDLNQTISERWGTVKGWLTALFAWRGIEGIMAEDVAILPGMEELANLLYIVDHAQSGKYDTIIVDCAPTGETLRLLSFPEIMDWWMRKLFPLERRAMKIVRPILQRAIDVPLPDESVFESMQTLFPQLTAMRGLLTDPEKTSVRLVVNPEKMVIKETQRSFTYLNLYGYFTDLIVCNRFIPARVSDPYFVYWKKNQEEYFREIEERFAPLPIFTVPLMEREVVGLDMLRLVAEKLFNEHNPNEFFYRGKVHEIEKDNGEYRLIFELPHTMKQDISVVKTGDEVIIRVGAFRRNVILPRTLAGLDVKRARFEAERLVISFHPAGSEPVASNT